MLLGLSTMYMWMQIKIVKNLQLWKRLGWTGLRYTFLLKYSLFINLTGWTTERDGITVKNICKEEKAKHLSLKHHITTPHALFQTPDLYGNGSYKIDNRNILDTIW